ncbi:hypothetical protein LMG31884_46940 (plasmid) [Xanthomonas hydrangeae]|uniref:DNA-binding protein n=1 Tax=Xanthomonas hydrangeae TaxID=2775159 RepID=UPI0019659C59|nr:hypothetical protein LMG31884_46940 [Xanthomonas hydrangeae]CAD7740832.1 hypothetical protein LMG31884_46940 [Xanthomonas hydrangeae]CAD7747866.1 hypothetical protein LMG31887_46040 [Xanthomonas hydrangeae]CAD7747867.1 hypothetical protein LMG31887_46040 [Xanthomonas hydrangeae]CAD7748256.1 hypothetical protein LMG31885_45450 [Xanthomonas hydrangeae]
MRPIEISNEEIIAAGKALLAEGRSVTGFALRRQTAGGNPSRLRQVWDEHVASSAEPSEPLAELPIELAELMNKVSADLTAQLSRLAADLNDKANKAAERRVAEVVRAASDQRQQTERELADAAATVDELETRLDDAKSELERQATAIAEQNAQLQAQAVDLARGSEQLSNERQRSERLANELAEAKRSALDATALQQHLATLVQQNVKLLAGMTPPTKRNGK